GLVAPSQFDATKPDVGVAMPVFACVTLIDAAQRVRPVAQGKLVVVGRHGLHRVTHDSGAILVEGPYWLAAGEVAARQLGDEVRARLIDGALHPHSARLPSTRRRGLVLAATGLG